MSNGIQLPPAPARKGKHPLLTIVLTIVVLAVILGGIYLWKYTRDQNQPGWQPHPVSVTAMTVKPQPLSRQLEAVGSLTAVEQVTLSSEVAGRIENIAFHSGQLVEPNQTLVQLFDGQEQAQLTSAQARLKFALHQLKRSQRLAPSGAESLDVLQERQSAYTQALGEVKRVEAQIRQKQILAPFAGQLGIRQVNLGQYLNPGDDAVTLTALDKLYVEFTLPQQEFSAITIGGDIHFTSDAYPQRNFTAKVHAIEPQIDRDTRNILVQGELENPDLALRPGMYVNAALQLPANPDAILVPETAVQISAQGYSMVVVRGDNASQQGKADIIAVKIGQRIDNKIEIIDGLNAGDVIVTVGQNRVQPGADVVVQQLVDNGDH